MEFKNLARFWQERTPRGRLVITGVVSAVLLAWAAMMSYCPISSPFESSAVVPLAGHDGGLLPVPALAFPSSSHSLYSTLSAPTTGVNQIVDGFISSDSNSPGIGTFAEPQDPSMTQQVSYTAYPTHNLLGDGVAAQPYAASALPAISSTRDFPAPQSFPPWQEANLSRDIAPPELVRPGVFAQAPVQPHMELPSALNFDAAEQGLSVQQTMWAQQGPLPNQGSLPEQATPSDASRFRYGRFVEQEISPEQPIKIVLGRARVIDLRVKPRRIYISDENKAGFQVITDRQFAVVGKTAGTTVLDLWFADPDAPNDPGRDITLSYMVIVGPPN